MKKIFVVGYGYVGKAMVDMLIGHYEVHVYDPEYNPVYNCDSSKVQS